MSVPEFESASTIWFETWLERVNEVRTMHRTRFPTDGYSHAALIANMEYVCASALEIVKARKGE